MWEAELVGLWKMNRYAYGTEDPTRFDSVSLVNNALMLVNIVASGWNKSGPSFTNGPGHLINNKVDHLLENR